MTKTSTKRKAIIKKEVKNNDVQGRNIVVDLDEIEVPVLRKIHSTKKVTPLTDKITLVLTAVNVAILISLVIKNI